MPITERADLDFANLSFNYTKADLNVRYTWKDGSWDDGVESDTDVLPLHIAATCLHYGQAIFEGMKVYEAKDGRILRFRAEENAKRMQRSAEKLSMQAPPQICTLRLLKGSLKLTLVSFHPTAVAQHFMFGRCFSEAALELAFSHRTNTRSSCW